MPTVDLQLLCFCDAAANIYRQFSNLDSPPRLQYLKLLQLLTRSVFKREIVDL